MFADTQNEYMGYYYEFNGKLFAGKEFNISNPEILKINPNNYNKLLGNPLTYVYGIISGNKISSLSNIPSYYFNKDTTNNVFRYFTKKINNNIIKEINEDTFKRIQNDSLYISVSLFYNSNFNENDLKAAEKRIPGITEYINTTYSPGATD